MKRESHLFASHKYFENLGSQILTCLAKVDLQDMQEVELLSNQLETYVTTLKSHARWEEEFIFNKFFNKEEILLLLEDHAELDGAGEKLLETLKVFLSFPPQSRADNGKAFYLEFRKFYADNLSHFYEEETRVLSLLQERASDEEIRAIDQLIYQSMSANDMVDMLLVLLPPVNISEKKHILKDLKAFNAHHFERAFPEIKKMLSAKEAEEIEHYLG